MKTIIKKAVATILLFTGMGTAHAQNNIEIAVGIAKDNCGDVSYVVYTGSKAYEEAKADAKRDCRDGKTPALESNGYKGGEGDYLVIIETNMKGYNGCNMSSFGIGFGDNYDDALQDARKNLGMRNWSWQESKHGYNVKLSKSY